MDEGEIRLVGGDNTSGRVEICLDGGWGTVCDNGWDKDDARVVCRQLGLPTSLSNLCIGKSHKDHTLILIIADSTAIHYAGFGRGEGPIHMVYVGCSGNESQLLGCSHNGTENYYCSHYEDAGVNCSSTLGQAYASVIYYVCH